MHEAIGLQLKQAQFAIMQGGGIGEGLDLRCFAPDRVDDRLQRPAEDVGAVCVGRVSQAGVQDEACQPAPIACRACSSETKKASVSNPAAAARAR